MLKATTLSNPTKISTKSIVQIGLLSAIAAVLMVFEIGTFVFPFFLKFEFSDIPAIIGTFSMGPIAGVLIELLKNLLKLLIKPTSSGGVGELANFLVGIAYIIPLGLIYKHKKSIKSIITGMVVSVLSMAIVAGLLNYFILLPFYSKFMPLDTIIEQSAQSISLINDKLSLVLYGITPFNLTKGIIISIAGYYLYIALKKSMKDKI